MKRALWLPIGCGIVCLRGLFACGDEGGGSGPALSADGGPGAAAVTGDGPIAPEVVARFAILVASCDPSRKAESIVLDLYDDEWPRHLRAVAACAAAKNNGCLALAECGGETYVRNGSKCRSRCDGDVVETCDDGILERRDCTKRGLRCFAHESGALPACSDPDAKRCDAGFGATSCGSDGTVYSCNSDNQHEVRGPRCADLGLECVPAGCKGTEGACTDSSFGQPPIAFRGPSCDGAKVRACVNGGFATFDCGRHVIGATCHVFDNLGLVDSAECGLGVACRTSTLDKGSCDGDSVVLCNRGRVDRVDCRALGFAGCAVESESSRAVCTPGP